MPVRIAILATGEFALPAFKELYDTDHDIAGLYTQPDRTGRGHHRHVNRLKEFAIQRETPVFQPENINEQAALDSLRELAPDLCVVAAYGQILSEELLAIPRLGAINLHASLLPRHRGAAPVHYTLLKGDKETGVTIFQIEPQLDAGLMLGQVKTLVSSDETTGQLHDRLAELAVPLTIQVIDQLEQGTAQGVLQDPQLVTLAPKMSKSFGLIDWNRSAEEIARHIRAMQPWPKAFTIFSQPGHEPLRTIITAAQVARIESSAAPRQPGFLVDDDAHTLAVQTGDGVLEVLQIQPAGKREMTAEEFMNGHTVSLTCQFRME